jgi:hypothetical protein
MYKLSVYLVPEAIEASIILIPPLPKGPCGERIES